MNHHRGEVAFEQVIIVIVVVIVVVVVDVVVVVVVSCFCSLLSSVILRLNPHRGEVAFEEVGVLCHEALHGVRDGTRVVFYPAMG